ncbi:MAG: hypothetical protein A3A51_04355 [Candidatus Levybacteria bacterium RIFCSPLOWO2_01_FULL_39_10]|nr:MAG: hypothetical protein A3A51_04355 [Candidatus Levybacteria bacterium RIFCSPLOWO2_01_FULL_39_10]
MQERQQPEFGFVNKDIHEEVTGEIPPEGMAAYREVPFPLKEGDPTEILTNPEELEKHERLIKIVETLREGGKEVWGSWSARKGFVFTGIVAAAAAAGAVGIGIYIKRKKDK